MKKKFVFILALVLMVAVTLTAAPLELTGNFKAGYKVTMTSGTNGVAGVNNASELSLGALSLTGDFWKIAIADGGANLLTFGDNQMAATASIYLDKALAAQGVDMGDLAVTLTIGNKATLGGLSAYTNSRDKLSGLKMASGEGDAYAAAVQFDYTSLVSVYVGADIAALDSSNKAVVISAKSAPIDGLNVAVAYTNIDDSSAKGSVAGSVAVDVAALAGIEDFGLTASAYDVYLISSKTNRLYLELKGSYDKISAWTEYRILDNKRNDMKFSASFAGIENVGLSAFVELDDITKVDALVADEVKIGAGVNYKMGGVTYAFDANYAIDAKTFTMSPTVKIAF